MKAILEFNLPEDAEDYELAINGAKTRFALDDVWEQVFRPFYKHGYKNERLNELTKDPKVEEAIQLMAEIYHGILDRNEVR